MTLLENGLRIGDVHVDAFDRAAAKRVRELLGPVVASHPFPGVGRTAQVLAGGVIMLIQDEGDELRSLMVCFDPRDASPYSAFAEVPTMTQGVELNGQRFVGGESEVDLARIPGVGVIRGLLTMKHGRLGVGLHTKKPLGRFGKRTGRRRLVMLDAEWGGPKPFPSTPSRPAANGETS